MLNRRNFLVAAVGVAAAGGLAACAKKGDAPAGSSGGADGKSSPSASPRSAPRAAGAPRTPSRSRTSAEEAGIELKFSDAQQKQENQIKAIRSFIQQKVDVIAFSPVVESGWDTVLQEAKRASIPVILTDRAVDSAGHALYKTFLGSDFVKEGRRAGEWLVEESDAATGAGQHRRAAGHDRLGAGERPQGGLRRGDRRPNPN